MATKADIVHLFKHNSPNSCERCKSAYSRYSSSPSLVKKYEFG